MIRVSVEVGSGIACFNVAVRAESIRRAVGIVETRYPGSEAQVVFPIDPEPFFVRELAAEVEPVELEMPGEHRGLNAG